MGDAMVKLLNHDVVPEKVWGGGRGGGMKGASKRHRDAIVFSNTRTPPLLPSLPFPCCV
jgi:hypothetical protein